MRRLTHRDYQGGFVEAKRPSLRACALTQGITDAGFEVLWGIDSDENPKPTYDQNHETVGGDIRPDQ